MIEFIFNNANLILTGFIGLTLILVIFRKKFKYTFIYSIIYTIFYGIFVLISDYVFGILSTPTQDVGSQIISGFFGGFILIIILFVYLFFLPGYLLCFITDINNKKKESK